MSEPVRVILVDDHPVVLEGLATGLTRDPRFDIVKTAPDFSAGRRLVEANGCHLLVTDLYLSEKRDGLNLLRFTRELRPSCKTVVLTYSTRAEDYLDASEAGADAYLIKDSGLREIADAFQMVLDGGKPPLPSELRAAISGNSLNEAPSASANFTQRELAILQLMVEGLTNEQIASRIFLSGRVIRRCNTSIYRKLAVRNRSEAIATALKQRII